MDYTYKDGKYKCDCGEEFSSYNSWYSHDKRGHSEAVKIGASKEDLTISNKFVPIEVYERKKEMSVNKRAAGAILTISLFMTIIAILWMIQSNTFQMRDRFNAFLDKYIPSGVGLDG